MADRSMILRMEPLNEIAFPSALSVRNPAPVTLVQLQLVVQEEHKQAGLEEPASSWPQLVPQLAEALAHSDVAVRLGGAAPGPGPVVATASVVAAVAAAVRPFQVCCVPPPCVARSHYRSGVLVGDQGAPPGVALYRGPTLPGAEFGFSFFGRGQVSTLAGRGKGCSLHFLCAASHVPLCC